MKASIALLSMISAAVFANPITNQLQAGKLKIRGEFPAGKEAAYMAQCQEVARGQGVDAATAAKHCACGADAIKKNFTDEEIQDLDSKDGVDAKLMMRAQTVVSLACAPKRS